MRSDVYVFVAHVLRVRNALLDVTHQTKIMNVINKNHNEWKNEKLIN